MHLLLVLGWSIYLPIAGVQPAQGAEIESEMRLVPTGDALFDQYAAEVTRQMAEFGSQAETALLAGQEPLLLPLEILDSWKGRYGKDPRYWQLYYWCALEVRNNLADEIVAAEYPPSISTLDPRNAEQRSRRNSELLTAFRSQCLRELGDALRLLPPDAESLLLLHRISRQGHGDALQAMCNKLQQQSPIYAGTVVAYDEMLTQRELEYLDIAVQLEPQLAWAYYERAMVMFSLGEFDQGLADLESGNSASNKLYPQLFPFSVVYSRLAGGQVSGSPELTSALLLQAESLATPDFIRIKGIGQELQMAAALNGDERAFDIYHDFGCRLGQAAPSDPLFTSVGVALCTMGPSYLLENIPGGLTDEDVEQYRCVWGTCRYVRKLLQEQNASESDFYSQLSFDAAAATFSGKSRHWFELASARQSNFMSRILPLLELLSQVDYTNGNTPDELRQYEHYLTEYEQLKAAGT